MFGLSSFSSKAFAQGPYNVFGADLLENIISDANNQVIATFASVISEAVTVADSIQGGFYLFITEGLNANDNNVGVGNFAANIFEDIQPADLQTVIASFVSAISEGNTLASIQVGGWNVSITEVATLADSPIGNGTFVFSVTEAITAFGDSSIANSATPVSITEAILSLLDNPIGLPTYAVNGLENISFASIQKGGWVVSSTESITLNNGQTVQAAFVGSVTENSNLVDSPSVIASFVSSELENIIFTSVQLGAAWIKIDDSQTTVWTPIDNRQ